MPGVPRTLEAPSNAPYAIAVDPDGTAVYWSHVDGDAGSAIVRMDKATLATREIVGHLGDVNAIAAGPTDVYVVDNGAGAVGRVPKDGGAFIPIHAGEINPRGIAVDSSHVWWTEAGYGSAGSNNGNVRRAGLDGSSPQVAYSGRVGPDGIAVSGNTLVWTEFESDDVAVGSTAGGSAPTTTFPNENRARAIVADGPDVFFTDYTYSVVRRFVLGGIPADHRHDPAKHRRRRHRPRRELRLLGRALGGRLALGNTERRAAAHQPGAEPPLSDAGRRGRCLRVLDRAGSLRLPHRLQGRRRDGPRHAHRQTAVD